MIAYLLRRKGLGFSVAPAISNKMEYSLGCVRNDNKFLPSREEAEVCIRWGCTSNVPQRKVFNTAKAIHTVSNKSGFRRLLSNTEPDTIPSTWWNYHEPIRLPVIIRPKHHHAGLNLYLCETWPEVVMAADKCGEDYYMSEYVDKVAEQRVFMAQGKIFAIAYKEPGNKADPDCVAWNGGVFHNVRWGEWSEAVCDVATRAFNQSGLDFGGVDVMIDGEGRAYVLEINSAPSITSPYRQGIIARIFDHMLEHGKEAIPNDDMLEGWRKYIHPVARNNKERAI